MQREISAGVQLEEAADGVLIHHTLEGNQAAFEILVRRYSLPLLKYISQRIRDSDLAYDVLQLVFLKLYLALPSFHRDKPVRSWLYLVARNYCIDLLRKRRPITFSALQEVHDENGLSTLEMIPDPTPQPEELAERRDLQELLQVLLRTLPPKLGAIVSLRYVNDLSFAEIGRLLNIPEATAKTYFHRAKLLLRNRAVLHALRRLL
jgi:RNA polymerase sigma factor (sigma-70 family)